MTQIKQPTSQELTKIAAGIQAAVNSIVITDDGMLEIASFELQDIKSRYKALEEKRKSITNPLDEAKKNVMALFKAPLEQIEQAEDKLKNAILAYQESKYAEAARIQAELNKKAEEEVARIQAEAAKAEDDGDLIAAITLQTTAAVIQAPVVVAQQTKLAGISTRSTWEAEVHDKSALIQFIVENPQFLHLIDVNQKELAKMAKAMKQNLNLPGVTVREKKTIASRSL